jgi:hypothetical protein
VIVTTSFHREQQPPAITLPKFDIAEIDIEREIAEAAARVAERKIVRAGLDAWRTIGKAESFESWKTIGRALCIGKHHALRVAGVKQAWGQHYSREFGNWMKEHHFDRMPASVRSHAIELSENIAAIESWRSTLSEQRRRRLQGPQHNVLQWRRETGQAQSKRSDAMAKAEAAWHRFVVCAESLPPAQAMPLWQTVHHEAAMRIAT